MNLLNRSLTFDAGNSLLLREFGQRHGFDASVYSSIGASSD